MEMKDESGADIIRAAHSVAVKVRKGGAGGRNGLCRILEKGDPLPTIGMKRFRAARGLTPGAKDNYLSLEFYQGQDEGLSETDFLFVGPCEITGKHLGNGMKIRAGDEITLRWKMIAGSILRVVAEFPHIGWKPCNFYTPQRGHRCPDFDKETEIVRSLLENARREADVLREAVGDGARAECEEFIRKIESRREILDNAVEAGAIHRVAAETRRLRESMSGLEHSPENLGGVLRQRIFSEDRDGFSRYIRRKADAETVDLFDMHRDEGLACIEEGDFRAAEFHLGEMGMICDRALSGDPAFLRDQFNLDMTREHLAADCEDYRLTLRRGLAAIDAGNFAELSGVIVVLRDIQVNVGSVARPAAVPASIVEA